MPTTVEKLSPTRVKMTIEVPFEELKPTLDRAYREIAQQVNVPGFRKGNVPPAIIDQRFGRGAVLSDAVNQALPGIYANAIDENDLHPLGQPDIEMTQLEDKKFVEFVAEVDVRPDFTLPDVSKVSVDVPMPAVEEGQIEEQIELLRERFATSVDVERAAAKDDLVIIDLAGKKNGEELEDASAEGISYIVGQEGMLEGLEEAVVGLSAGENATFESELVGGPLRGEKVDITVTVQKVQQRELPEVDDEFAQMVSEFDTAEEMRADLSKNLENRARLEQADEARNKVLESILEELDFELPEKFLEEQVKNRHDQINAQLARAGMTLDQYLENSDDAENAEEFWADVDKAAESAVRGQLVLDQYADEADVQVGDQDMMQHIMYRAQQNGTSPQEEFQHMNEHGHQAEWAQEIRRSKAMADMVEKAKITDGEGNDLDFSRLRQDGSLASEEELQAARDAAAAMEEAQAAAAAEGAANKADESESEAPADDETADGETADGEKAEDA